MLNSASIVNADLSEAKYSTALATRPDFRIGRLESAAEETQTLL
jgi:hypothetical protein